MERTPKPCALCGGSGWLHLLNSWFRSDGFRRERCGICAGTGKSDYRPDAEWIRKQAEFRAAAKGEKNEAV